MPLEDFEAGLQKALEFGISGGWNQCSLKRAIHGRVVRYLISSVSLVKGCAIKLRQFSTFLRRCLR